MNTTRAALPLAATARLLSVPATWLRTEAEAGRLPCLRAGSAFLFDVDLIERLLLVLLANKPSPARRASAMSDAALSLPTVGLTVREVARRYRVSPAKIRSWIKSGRLGAINTSSARCGKPRFIILPRHLEEFEQQRSAALPPKLPRRTKKVGFVDYYPD